MANICDDCGKKLASYHSLWRHKKNRVCKSADATPSKDVSIPTFLPEKIEESEPLVKVIKLSADVVPSIFSSHATSYDDQDDDDDRLLTESEFKELWGRFKTLHHELIHERKRENIMELNKILQIRLEEKMLNHIDYMKAINAINKDYLATYL